MPSSLNRWRREQALREPQLAAPLGDPGSVKGREGRDAVTSLAVTPHDEHSSRPRALALTQATELGTLYSRQELERLCALAHALGMKVQLDGARFANAIASLACKPADISWRAGVDVLCFGGTKNGTGIGDAVVFFDTELAVIASIKGVRDTTALKFPLVPRTQPPPKK
jgi:threonine aldolase